jgi:hypothetical protein
MALRSAADIPVTNDPVRPTEQLGKNATDGIKKAQQQGCFTNMHYLLITYEKRYPVI